MTTETRYMRSDTWTVNGLLAYKLTITQSTSFVQNYITHGGMMTADWGIRVWKRSSVGVETEITAGTPVAQVERTTYGSGLQSNTWNCPLTALDSTDVIVVRVYCTLDYLTWYVQAVFVTEQLGASSLDSAIWTVYYYTSWDYDYDSDLTLAYFIWGTSTFNSRITNFNWSALAVAPISIGDGLTWVVYLFNKSKKPLRGLASKGLLVKA